MRFCKQLSLLVLMFFLQACGGIQVKDAEGNILDGVPVRIAMPIEKVVALYEGAEAATCQSDVDDFLVPGDFKLLMLHKEYGTRPSKKLYYISSKAQFFGSKKLTVKVDANGQLSEISSETTPVNPIEPGVDLLKTILGIAYPSSTTNKALAVEMIYTVCMHERTLEQTTLEQTKWTLTGTFSSTTKPVLPIPILKKEEPKKEEPKKEGSQPATP